MRWLSRAIAAIIDAVVEVVDQVLTAVVEFVADVIESIGHGLGAFFRWLAELAAQNPENQNAANALRWIGNAIEAVFDLVATVVKAVGSYVIDQITGWLRVIGGILSLNGRLILKGLDDLVSGFVGLVVIVVLQVVELLQTALFVQQPGRRLTAAERALLTRIYRNSLALGAIRINVDTSGVFSVNPWPFVVGNTIFLKGANVDPADPAGDPAILVHESVHVWQYQHEGSSYIGRALGNQLFTPATANSIAGWLTEVAAGSLRWVEFSKESQAWFVEDVYTNGELLTAGGATTTGNGVFFDADGTTSNGRFTRGGVDHTGLANDAVAAIRRRISFRLSQWF